METPVDDLSPSLLAAAIGGDGMAYAAVLHWSAGRLRRRFNRLLHSTHGIEAEDLVQETLLTVHAKWHTYDPRRPFAPWLMAVARHKLIDALRRQHLHLPLEAALDVAAADEAPSPDVPKLAPLLASLPEAQRSAITLVRLEERSIAEAAQQLSRSPGAVKLLVHRGMTALRRKVNP